MNREEQISNANPYAGSSDIGFGKMVGFKAGAKWADEHPVSPWISVEERLPEPHTKVFFIVRYTDHVSHYVGFWHNGEWETDDRIITPNSKYSKTIHWMPIPE